MRINIPDMVSVIVVNWNGEKYIKDCLSSLRIQTYPKKEIILVDNGSKDNSLAIVEEYFPEVRVIKLSQNCGFAKANNIALEEAKGEFICLLNNDAFPENNWVEELVKTIKPFPEAAAVGSKMLNYDNREIIDSAGDGYTRMGWPDKIGSGTKVDDKYEHIREVISICAGAALYRRSVLDKGGFFDEDFFAYLEDVDLSLRINMMGFKCIYVPTGIVYHVGSATTGSKINHFTVYWSTRNYFPVILKNLPTKLIVKFIPLMMVFHIYWIIACIRKKVFTAYLRGIKDALCTKNLFSMLQKRKLLKKLWRLSSKEIHQRIIKSEREILEGIYRKRIFQGRRVGDVKACIRILHGGYNWRNL